MPHQQVSAARRLAIRYWPWETATPSKYLRHLLKPPRTSVVLYDRASINAQHHDGRLAEQEADAVRRLEQLGCHVVTVIGGVESGRWLDKDARVTLTRAIEAARELGAVLVAESISRFVRSWEYDHKWNQQARPSVREMEDLMRMADGVPLATLEHPDITPAEERGLQTKRGMRAKGAKPGRPMRKKNRRERLLPKALAMKEAGASLRQIEAELGVRHTTVRDWLRRG